MPSETATAAIASRPCGAAAEVTARPGRASVMRVGIDGSADGTGVQPAVDVTQVTIPAEDLAPRLPLVKRRRETKDRDQQHHQWHDEDDDTHQHRGRPER